MDLRAILKMLKFKLCLPPILANGAAFAGNTYVDTQGLGAILFLLTTGTIAADIGSTAATTPPLIEECDTTDGSYTAVTNAELADVIAATEDDTLWGIYVDLTKSHKRYMQVQAPTAGTGACMLAIHAIGFPVDESPRNAAGMGLTELIEA